MTQSDLATELERVKARLRAIAPAHCNVDEITGNVLWVVGQDGDLSRCSPRSIIEAVMDALAMGLDPSGLTGEGTLIPRRTKSGGFRATFVPDYRALLKLALAHPRVSHVEARIVRVGDDFTLDFGDPEGRIVRHRPALGGEEGEPLGAYAIAWFRDSSRPLVEWMSKPEIDANAERGGSFGGDNSPWETDWPEMARKTVIKRLLKYLPLAKLEAAGPAAIAEKSETAAGFTSAPSSLAEEYRASVLNADAESIEHVIQAIRGEDRLDHMEKTELFNLATTRKRELRKKS